MTPRPAAVLPLAVEGLIGSNPAWLAWPGPSGMPARRTGFDRLYLKLELYEIRLGRQVK